MSKQKRNCVLNKQKSNLKKKGGRVNSARGAQQKMSGFA
jgi:hypothetical protein